MNPSTATTSTTSLISQPEPPKLTRSISLPAPTTKTTAKKGLSWRKRLHARRAAPVPGKEKWRDATLSEDERWKDWHKAKDAERKAGSTAGYYTGFYKAKGGWAWWIGVTGEL